MKERPSQDSIPTESAVELLIFDTFGGGVTVHARCDADMAVTRIKLDSRWDDLLTFRERLHSGLRGTGNRPSSKEVDRFGRDLFSFLMRDDVATLYEAVGRVEVWRRLSVTLFSDRPEVQNVPWEYLQEPGSAGGPGERAIVRLLPTIGLTAPPSVPPIANVRLLLVSADPVTQMSVSWPDVEATLQRVFLAKAPKALELTVIEGATQAAISRALRAKTYDVFHFSGHGEVRDGQGGLLLTGTPDFLPASRLASLFKGSAVRLAVLSACETSAGNRKDSFGVVSDALIRAGLPAVVANQLPVPNATVAAFVGALYEELLVSGNIDRAVTQGRKALAYELNRIDGELGIEWGIPTLHRLIGAARIYAP